MSWFTLSLKEIYLGWNKKNKFPVISSKIFFVFKLQQAIELSHNLINIEKGGRVRI